MWPVFFSSFSHSMGSGSGIQDRRHFGAFSLVSCVRMDSPIWRRYFECDDRSLQAISIWKLAYKKKSYKCGINSVHPYILSCIIHGGQAKSFLASAGDEQICSLQGARDMCIQVIWLAERVLLSIFVVYIWVSHYSRVLVVYLHIVVLVAMSPLLE